ncbi:MAG: hypothetical protein IT518_11170 [Burkholderiales bacterium]|nr:hypothetical protein [Burkholderiales bacterium]
MDRHGPWNPGIESQIPASLLPLATLYRPEHARAALRDLAELADLTGLPLRDLVPLRPERLALHELLVRVTANLSVDDGTRIEDLGINFRGITQTILDRDVLPRMAELVHAYDEARAALERIVGRELARLDPVAAPPPHTGWLARLRGRRGPPAAAAPPPGAEAALALEWEARVGSAPPAERAALRALAHVVSALLVRHGRLWGDRSLVARAAVDLAANEHGSAVIGEAIEPWIAQAARREGFRLLARQDHPVVMNTKGPSAAGKSTMRPLQKQLARRIGVDWGEFALISPDIWRKQLLDYASLGPHYKYAGAFTGDELAIVDHKLDRYIAEKARRGALSHLLIDRFRFDSFAPDSDEAGSNLLTRFGQIVYMFFLVTPPAALVERAWNRGLDVGRYKAVDDTLAHAVEAYAGMPELFFTWIRRSDKRVHFEVLDNSVARGEPPRTAAFGWNETLNVLDVECLLDAERYRKVDVDARAPDELYPDAAALAPARNCAFLARCVAEFREVNFAAQRSGRIYLRVVEGRVAGTDAGAPPGALDVLRILLQGLDAAPALAQPAYLADSERTYTVGAWK